MIQPSIKLKRRCEPIQARAKESVNIILRTAAEVLDEIGIDGFNTNLLAERAGVQVRTVYRYFPNKYSVIVALTEELANSWDTWMTPFYEQIADPSVDWRKAVLIQQDNWIAHCLREPRSIAVQQAMYATPELRELHKRIFENGCRKFAQALKKRGLDIQPHKLLAIGRTFMASNNACIDLFFELNGKARKAFREEHNKCLLAYLEKHLNSE